MISPKDIFFVVKAFRGEEADMRIGSADISHAIILAFSHDDHHPTTLPESYSESPSYKFGKSSSV